MSSTPKHSIENFKIHHDCSGHVIGATSWALSKALPEISDAEIEAFTSNTSYGSSSGTYTGGSWLPGTVPQTPTVGTNPYPNTAAPATTFGTISTSFGFPMPSEEEETDECADGHFIDHKSVRTIFEDDEDQITGQCLFCGITVYLPELEGALAFERAGKAVGRAMTLEDGDGENIGALLADVAKIERDLKAEMTKFRRALGMLEIARDLVEQRACA